MIKTIAVPKKNNYNLVIPNKYIGKKIEILFYAIDELTEQNDLPKKIKLSEKYKGSISKEQGEDLKKHINHMRSDWSDI